MSLDPRVRVSVKSEMSISSAQAELAFEANNGDGHMTTRLQLLPALLAAFLLLPAVQSCGGECDEAASGWGTTPKGEEILPCDLMITEFMAKVGSPVKGKRWIELFNASGETIDMGMVRLKLLKEGAKSVAEIEMRQGGGFLLPPGEYLWVRIDADPLPEEQVGQLNVYQTDKNVALAESAFEMWLESRNGTIIHRIRFGATGTICDGDGLLAPVSVSTDQSIELQRPFFSCEASQTGCDAWQPASAGTIPGVDGIGTPGEPPPITAASLGLPRPVQGEVAVTEVMYRSSDDNQSADWFELVGLADHSISLQGCIIGDGTASGDHTIKSPLPMCNGQYVLLSSKDMDNVDEDYIFSKPNLNQTGDTLYMRCPNEVGQTVEVFNLDFTSSGTYPVSKADHGNASVQACPPGDPATLPVDQTHNSSYWQVTTEGNVGQTQDLGSPGQPNTCPVPCVCDPACTGTTMCTPVGEGCQCLAPPVTPGPGDLVVTEFLSNSSEACSGKDWVEVLNLTDDNLTLKDCTLADANNNPVTIKDEVLIAPGTYMALLQGAKDTPFDAPSYYGFGSSPNLDKGGDTFVLACGGQEVVSLGFGSKGELPKPVDGEAGGRVSVQLRPTGDDSPPTAGYAADPLNWELSCKPSACGDIASPGAANKACGTTVQCDPACSDGQTCMDYWGQLVCARMPGIEELVPTEYLSNASGACSGSDWVEIYNLSTDFLTLVGCEVADANNSPTALTSNYCLVPPMSHFVLVQAADDGLNFDALDYCGFGGSPNFDKGGDIITLNCGGTDMFSIGFGSDGEFPKPGDEGEARVSAQLQPPWGVIDYQYAISPQNWNLSCTAQSCGDLATPGADNEDCPF